MKVDLDGEFGVAATVDETFAFITDPERFAPILPYFKKLTVAEGRKFTVVLEVGVPQIRGTAEVDAELVEEQAPQRAVYSVKGRHTLGMMDSTITFFIAAATPSGANWAKQRFGKFPACCERAFNIRSTIVKTRWLTRCSSPAKWTQTSRIASSPCGSMN